MPATPRGYEVKRGGPSKRRLSGGNGEEATWRHANAEAVLELIARVTERDGAVRFGLNRSKSQLTLGFYGDGDPYTDYYSDGEDFDIDLAKLIASWGDQPEV